MCHREATLAYKRTVSDVSALLGPNAGLERPLDNCFNYTAISYVNISSGKLIIVYSFCIRRSAPHIDAIRVRID